jgi:energy-coupling factor transporter transmembrane protein EcfT
VHPATCILLFACSALALPGLNFFETLVATLGLLLTLPRGGFETAWRLARRSRWLFLIILLGYAYSLPGAPLWPTLGDFSPSIPGLRAGALQAVRLLLLLLVLDRCVLRLDEVFLLAGLHRLLRPFEPLGVASERVTVRLALTLRRMQTGHQVFARNIGEWLPLSTAEEADAPASIALPVLEWHARDGVALILASAFVLAVWLRA